MIPLCRPVQTCADRSADRPKSQPHGHDRVTGLCRPYTPYYIYKGYILVYGSGNALSEKCGLRPARSAQVNLTTLGIYPYV